MTMMTNVNVYDLENAVISGGFAMIENFDEHQFDKDSLDFTTELFESEDYTDNKHFKRAVKLGNTAANSGHGNYLKGVLVAFNLTCSNKMWIEAQRYGHFTIVTGMSTMHRLSKFDLDNAFTDYTDPVIIARLKELQEKYNETKDKEDYLRLLHSCPNGLQMTGRVTTNYMQLKNIWIQRHNHRLPEWRQFCNEILELPYFKEFTGCGK